MSPHDRIYSEETEGGVGNAGRVAKALLPYLWPRDRADLRFRVVVASIAMVASKFVTVSVPFFLKEAVDTLTGAGLTGTEAVAAVAVSVPLFMILGYAFARIMMTALQQLRDALFAAVSQHAERVLAVETFAHLHSLSLRFHMERRTGGLSRIIERGTRSIDFLLRFTLFNIVPTLIELALAAGILIVMFGWGYGVATVVTVLGYIVFTFRVTEWRTKFRRRMNTSDTEANTKAVDSLLNFETVKYFTNEGHETRRLDKALASYERAAVQTMSSLSLLNTGQAVIFTGGLALLMVMAARGVAAGTMTVGDFVLVNTFMMQLFVPLNMLGFVYREIRQALIDIEKLFDLRQIDPEVADPPGARPLAVSAGEIRFDKVRFAYDARRPILKDVSFSVPAGKTLGIVGPTGAGKSTLSRILFRFYDIESGTVTIDGQDIRAVTQESLRRAVGIVPQDTVLFNDTIAYNICYGRPDATDEEVVAAAKAAQIHDFVMGLPDGYKTMVGERGLKLSGGEKQRVAIARTILKDPPILMLDEATSALDTATEREVQAAISAVSASRTTLVIAHRLATIVDADEILVLDRGAVVERGSHSELLKLGGTYAELWARQQEAQADEDTDALEAGGAPIPAAAEPQTS